MAKRHIQNIIGPNRKNAMASIHFSIASSSLSDMKFIISENIRQKNAENKATNESPSL